VVWLGKRHFPVNHSEVESRPKLEANQQLVRDEAKKNNKCQLIWDFTNLNWLIDGVHFLGGEYCVTLGAW